MKLTTRLCLRAEVDNEWSCTSTLCVPSWLEHGQLYPYLYLLEWWCIYSTVFTYVHVIF